MKKYSKIIKNKDCLFRYRKADEKSIAALREDKLFFSKPEYFNDPYDNLIFANSIQIIGEILGNICLEMDKYLGSRKNQIRGIDVMEAIWNNKESKRITIDEHSNRIFSAIETVRINLKKNTKIICFSENNNSMLMWSHYADYHKGFLLVYEKTSIENAEKYNQKGEKIITKTKLVPVEYVDNQTDMTKPVLEYIRHNMLENMGDVETKDATIPPSVIRTVISEKSKEWSYEKEWRLIPRVPKIEVESELCYIKCKPLAVVVGSQCRGVEREEIISICKTKNIPIYGMFLDDSKAEFKLSINDNGCLDFATPNYVFLYNE